MENPSWNWFNIGSGNGFFLDGTKQLPKPMLIDSSVVSVLAFTGGMGEHNVNCSMDLFGVTQNLDLFSVKHHTLVGKVKFTDIHTQAMTRTSNTSLLACEQGWVNKFTNLFLALLGFVAVVVFHQKIFWGQQMLVWTLSSLHPGRSSVEAVQRECPDWYS